MKPSRRERKLAKEKEQRRLKAERERAMLAQRSEPTVPASPISGTRLVTEDDDDVTIENDVIIEIALKDIVRVRSRKYDARPMLACARTLDAERALDWRIYHMIRQQVISPEAMEALRCCITLHDFLSSRMRHWTKELKQELQFLRGKRLWDGLNHPTEFGEELWDLFRRRVRREGAIDQILQKCIRRQPLRRVA